MIARNNSKNTWYGSARFKVVMRTHTLYEALVLLTLFKTLKRVDIKSLSWLKLIECFLNRHFAL